MPVSLSHCLMPHPRKLRIQRNSRNIALNFAPENMDHDPHAVERFRREALVALSATIGRTLTFSATRSKDSLKLRRWSTRNLVAEADDFEAA
jgi:hypothetical protein